MKAGFGLLNNTDLRESAEIARTAERLGYDSIWVSEHNFSRDAIGLCGVSAFHTERVLIGTGVVPILTRSPLLLANTFAALDELSRGRMILGLGAGSRVLIRAQGIPYEKPLTALREYIEVCRAVWSSHGEPVTYKGAIVNVENAELDFNPIREHIPIWIGSTGPKSCELTGQIGNGVVLNGFLPASYVSSAREWLAKGAASVGRSLEGFPVSMMIITAVAPSKEEAHEYLRPLVALYLSRLPDIAVHTSIWGEAGERWRRLVGAVNAGGAENGKKHVSDELIDEITACGTAEECHLAVQRYVEAGVTDPIVTGFGNLRAALEGMAPGAERGQA